MPECYWWWGTNNGNFGFGLLEREISGEISKHTDVSETQLIAVYQYLFKAIIVEVYIDVFWWPNVHVHHIFEMFVRHLWWKWNCRIFNHFPKLVTNIFCLRQLSPTGDSSTSIWLDPKVHLTKAITMVRIIWFICYIWSVWMYGWDICR